MANRIDIDDEDLELILRAIDFEADSIDESKRGRMIRAKYEKLRTKLTQHRRRNPHPDECDDYEENQPRPEWTRPKGVPPGVPVLPFKNPSSVFSAKGERMYEDIKAGYGKDPRAAEIAARTVYERAAEGTPGLLKKR